MPDADERAPRSTRPRDPAARALRVVLDGLQDAHPELCAAAEPAPLYRGLVVTLLRLVFLRAAGRPPATWRDLLDTCERLHRAHATRLFAPDLHALDRLQLPAPVLARAAAELAPLQLGAVHESLTSLQLARDHGHLELRASGQRRRSSSHYTPPALSAPLVAITLRPRLLELGPDLERRSSLRICDPAMGCGAFLIAACEHLTADIHEPAALTRARRTIARECLRGVDLDPLAVELARLSLWLHVADPTLPLDVFDATLRHGDSLVGATPAQIAAFTWHPDPAHAPTHTPALEHPLPASTHTPALEHPLPAHAPTHTPALEHAHAHLRGDALVAAFFAATRASRREPTRLALRPLAELARLGDPAALAELTALRAALHARTPPVTPFHWSLEFSDVFTRPRPGFDAMLGNPPYFWGNRIGRCFGDAYRDWLQRLHPGAHGNSDLAAHFLRRAYDLLRDGGSLGFITTNSISEAETRAAGLGHLIDHGGVLYDAQRDLPWPGDASVRISRICVRRGPVPGPHRLDGRDVPAIASDLRPLAGAPPARLPARAGQSFKGVDFGGTGFLLDPAARAELLRRAPDESPHIWPVLNASGLTTSPTLRPAGHIINLSGLDLDQAAALAPRCLEIVRRDVLPRRLVDRRRSRRERWWLYNEACPGLYRAIAGLPRVLVGPVVAKHLVFGFVDPRVVYTNALNVFAFADPAALALLQSRVHELWALRHASSLRSDPRYNPTTCFETYPFPPDWRTSPALHTAGAAYDDHRAAILRRRDIGLTALYNRFHDPDERAPDILELREHHAALDRAVLTAHGWHDLAHAPCAHQRDPGDPPRWRLRWPTPLADEIYTRLLAANHAAPAA